MHARPSLLRATLVAPLLALAPVPAQALIPRVAACTPPGWAAPVVARVAGDVTDTADVQPSAQLRTDQPTWLDWASCGNSAAGGGWTDALYLDGQLISLVGRPIGSYSAYHYFYSLNDGPVWVGSGRHTLMVHADLYGQMLDGPGDLADDFASRTYLWPPTPAPWGAIAGYGTPPPRGDPPYNCSAYALPRPGIFPWCLSAVGATPVGLLLYDDYVNSTSGYSHLLGATAPAADTLDLLVGNGDPGPATVYAGVTRGLADVVTWVDLYSNDAGATARIGNGGSRWTSQSLPALGVGEVFRVTLQAGQPSSILLTQLTGTGDLAVALFPAGSGGVFSLKDAIARSGASGVQPGYDTLTFVPPASGDYPLVVHRTTMTGLGTESLYNLGLSPTVSVGPPAAAGVALDAGPNPARTATRVSWSLESAGALALTVVDAQGRTVRTLARGGREAGAGATTWDLADDDGRAVPAGLYWVRLEASGRSLVRRIAVVR